MTSPENAALANALLEQSRAAAIAGRWADAAQLGSTAADIDPQNADARTIHLAALDMLTPLTAKDDQTGVVYVVRRETPRATWAARVSAAYLLAALTCLAFLLLDTWSGRNVSVHHLGFDRTTLRSDTYRLLAFTAIGGGLGATLDGLRANIGWHSERRAYGTAFLWRDLASPWIGATLGVLVYGALRAGVAAVSGDFSLTPSGGSASLAAFSVAGLAGFSWHQVFKWLDDRGNALFKVSGSNTNSVPPAFTSGAGVSSAVGTALSFSVTATGTPQPTLAVSGDLPPGVTFIPATGLLAGLPLAGAGGIYPLRLVATNGCPPDAVQPFTLTIRDAPRITSPDHVTFTVGSSSGFSLSATGVPRPSLSVSGELPAGVTFDPALGHLAGVPGNGTAGVYPLVLTAANEAAHAAQMLTLRVNEPAA